MKMNLPNRLTILRMILVPVFCFFYLTKSIPYPVNQWIALVIFVFASFTDSLDGHIARRYNLVTDFGKFMDPLADKLLVDCALICFTWTQAVPVWMTLILIGREFVISGFRLIAAEKGVVIAAGIYGKIKTVFQMLAVIAILLPSESAFLTVLRMILLYGSVIFSVISLFDYFIRNKDVLKEGSQK